MKRTGTPRQASRLLAQTPIICIPIPTPCPTQRCPDGFEALPAHVHPPFWAREELVAVPVANLERPPGLPLEDSFPAPQPGGSNMANYSWSLELGPDEAQGSQRDLGEHLMPPTAAETGRNLQKVT